VEIDGHFGDWEGWGWEDNLCQEAGRGTVAGQTQDCSAKRLAEELLLDRHKIVLLDSDRVRYINKNRDFSDESRKAHLMGLAQAAMEAEQNGALVIVAAIAPKREWRSAMRAMWRNSRLVYMPGGYMWPGTSYEQVEEDEY
jgi:adenylylsulfate kinase-like enzyme